MVSHGCRPLWQGGQVPSSCHWIFLFAKAGALAGQLAAQQLPGPRRRDRRDRRDRSPQSPGLGGLEEFQVLAPRYVIIQWVY